MFMLSFAGLLKYSPIYIPDHAIDAMDVARSSLHPLNDSPFNGDFPRHRIRLHYGTMTEPRWRRVERRSDVTFKQVIVLRDAIRVWSALKESGATRAAQVVSLAVQGTHLPRRWPFDGPVTAFVPVDAAFPHVPDAILSERNRRALAGFVLDHVVAGAAVPRANHVLTTLGGRRLSVSGNNDVVLVQGARILQRLDVAPHHVYLLDGPVVGPPSAS